MKNKNKRILICGATGFIGKTLSGFLTNNKYIVEPITRQHLSLPTRELADYLTGALAIFNFAGAPILSNWTEKNKKAIYDSRIKTTRKLVDAIKQSTYKPELFFSTSAVGIYDSYEVHDEFSTNFANDFLSHICIDWEKEAFQLCNLQSTRVIIGRLGIVLGNGGGAYPSMITPFKLGLGGRIGDGYQCMPFIHINDLTCALWFFLNNKNCKGIYNLVAPQMISNREFSQKLSKALHRPHIVTVPKWILKLIYGDGAILLIQGQKVIPKRLKDNHFPFEFPTIDQAIKDLLKTTKDPEPKGHI